MDVSDAYSHSYYINENNELKCGHTKNIFKKEQKK
jgi:hypothetical protein